MNATLETVKPIANELTEPSHTPGPWRADQWANGWSVGAPKAGLTVCVLNNFANEQLNARLIASAPELLAACQMLLVRLEKMPGLPKGSVYDYARTAIAKAKGEIYTPVF